MSLRTKVQDIIQGDLPANAYANQLKKDIARVEQFSKECDRILPTLPDSDSIDKQIIAWYDTYGRIPYTHDKNDTIDTAGTSVILQDLVDRYKQTQPQPQPDFAAFVSQLENNNTEKQHMVNALQQRFSGAFASPLASKLTEAEDLERQLHTFIRTINNNKK